MHPDLQSMSKFFPVSVQSLSLTIVTSRPLMRVGAEGTLKLAQAAADRFDTRSVTIYIDTVCHLMHIVNPFCSPVLYPSCEQGQPAQRDTLLGEAVGGFEDGLHHGLDDENGSYMGRLKIVLVLPVMCTSLALSRCPILSLG